MSEEEGYTWRITADFLEDKPILQKKFGRTFMCGLKKVKEQGGRPLFQYILSCTITIADSMGNPIMEEEARLYKSGSLKTVQISNSVLTGYGTDLDKPDEDYLIVYTVTMTNGEAFQWEQGLHLEYKPQETAHLRALNRRKHNPPLNV